jgi:hypothetical protein
MLRKNSGNKIKEVSTSTDPSSAPLLLLYCYSEASEYFQKNLIGNPFGYACDICDRLRYMNDLKQVKNLSVLTP